MEAGAAEVAGLLHFPGKAELPGLHHDHGPGGPGELYFSQHPVR